MTVTAILKGRVDKNGHQTIYIRFTDVKKRTYFSTGIKVSPELFERGRVSKKHPKHHEINKRIETLIIQYQAQTIAPGRSPKVYLLDYIERSIQQLEHIQKPGTVRQYRAQLSKLKNYTKDILLTSVNHDFLYGYQTFLVNLGNDSNTVWSSFKFLRKMINKALKEDLLTKSPFRNFPFPKYTDKIKEYLLPDEIQTIKKIINKPSCPEQMKFAGTWFLIACRTGLRFSDIKNFDRRRNIRGGRIVIQTEKTSEPVGLPLSNELKMLFGRIHYLAWPYTIEDYNRLLKAIAAAAGINKRISSHTARHTAAMTLANAQVSEEVTAKILGHRDRRATRIYYKITNQRIDEELKKLR